MMKCLRKLIVLLMMMYTCVRTNLTNCPITGADLRSASGRLRCNVTYQYHCLLNRKGNLVEKCLKFSWMTKGHCPVFIENANNGLGAIHEKICQKDDGYVKGCPSNRAYKSSEVFQFPACFVVANRIKTTATQLITADNTREHDKETVTSIVAKYEDYVGFTGGGIFGKTAGVIVPLLVFGIISIVTYIKHRRRQDCSQGTENRIIQLAAFADGVHDLKEYGILIITGQTGSGKTTAMESIIQRLQEEDSEWKVKDISFLTLGRSNSSNDKLLIKWDDCFGKFVTNPVKRKNTMDMFRKIFEWVAEGDGHRKCILTMREIEFFSFNLNESDLFRTNHKAANNKVCLDNLSEREKISLVAEISKAVCSCDECSDIHSTKVIHELMGDTESVTLSLLGWPLICRLATIPYIAKNIKAFKEDPIRCVMSLFDTLKSTNQRLYCAMIYVLFKGGNICRIDTAFLKEVREKLAPAQDGDKLMGNGNSEGTDDPMKFSRYELNKIFCTHSHYFVNKDEDCFEFHHEIFVLWLLCHFYQSFPETTIKHFEFDVLIELLRPKNYMVQKDERDIVMLCSLADKNNVPKEHAVIEKYYNQAELVNEYKDKKSVQCEEDIEQRVHFETGIQTISSNMLKGTEETEEERSEYQSWRFTLEEKVFPCFIKRVVKEREGVQKLNVEKKQKYDMLEGHPLLEDRTFRCIYSQEKALISIQGSK